MISTLLKSLFKIFGPSGTNLAWGKFTTAGTGAVTINEAHGLTVARTGVGTFLVTCAVPCKALCVTVGVAFSTAAQSVIITAEAPSSGTFTVKTVGAGGSTAADTTGLTLHLQVLQRMNS